MSRLLIVSKRNLFSSSFLFYCGGSDKVLIVIVFKIDGFNCDHYEYNDLILISAQMKYLSISIESSITLTVHKLLACI
jgi:hypothetical protein